MPVEYRDQREDYIRLLIERMLPEVARQRLAEYADAFVDAHAFTVGRGADGARGGPRARAGRAAARRPAGRRRRGVDWPPNWARPRPTTSSTPRTAGIEALARAGTCGVLLPAATFFLMMDATPPGRKLIEAGVPVVVATDFNPGSCPAESMSAALWFACLTARLTVDEAITPSTLNAAHSLGRAGQHRQPGAGQAGRPRRPRVPNRYHLVYRFGAPRVGKVIVNGRVVYERETRSEPRPRSARRVERAPRPRNW